MNEKNVTSAVQHYFHSGNTDPQSEYCDITQFTKMQEQDVVTKEDKDKVFSLPFFHRNMSQSGERKLTLMRQQSTAEHRSTHMKVQYSIPQNEIHVLIIYKQYDADCPHIARKMVERLLALNCQVYLEQNAYNEIRRHISESSVQLFTPSTDIMLLITIGGDGTILYGLKQFQTDDYSPPILAFQKGTLGFMCMFDLQNMDSILENQIETFRNQKQFVVEKKLRLRGRIMKGDQLVTEAFVLNEFVISRGGNTACLHLNIFINSQHLTTASGDGLIVSTPTGSTAYFLSAGGPIVQNEVQSIGIAPICPLSLSFRPIVLPSCLKIEIKLSEQTRMGGFICADGQSTHEFTKEMTFIIERATQDAQVIQQKSDTDYSIWVEKLKEQLSWNKAFHYEKQKSNL